MIEAHVHKATLVDQVIDAIGHRFAIGKRKKVIHIDAGILSCCLPFAPTILKIAKQFLLFAIDRDDRIAVLLKRFAGAVDVVKLGISIRMRCALAARACTRWCKDLVVHLTRLIGSPLGSSSCSRSSSSVASVSTSFFMPP